MDFDKKIYMQDGDGMPAGDAPAEGGDNTGEDKAPVEEGTEGGENQ